MNVRHRTTRTARFLKARRPQGLFACDGKLSLYMLHSFSTFV